MSEPQVWRERRFSATEAAFAGFRLLQREPTTLLIWAALLAAVGLGLGMLTVVTIGPVFSQLQSMPTGPTADPAAGLALFQRLGPLYALILPLTLLFYAVAYGAVNRAVLRPTAAPGFGRLAVGGDELRQLIVLVLLGLLFLAAYIVVVILAVIVGVGVALAAKAAGATGAGVLLGVLAAAAVFCGFVFAAVRLSLASPLTFDTERVSVFGSWRLTRGRFWALFGAYLLSGILLMLLSLVAVVVVAAILAATGGGLQAAAVVLRPDMSSLSAYLSPAMLAWLAVSACVNSLGLAMLIGTPAAAYAQIRELETPVAPTTGF